VAATCFFPVDRTFLTREAIGIARVKCSILTLLFRIARRDQSDGAKFVYLLFVEALSLCQSSIGIESCELLGPCSPRPDQRLRRLWPSCVDHRSRACPDFIRIDDIHSDRFFNSERAIFEETQRSTMCTSLRRRRIGVTEVLGMTISRVSTTTTMVWRHLRDQISHASVPAQLARDTPAACPTHWHDDTDHRQSTSNV
jgi:hypothetical protein